MAEHSLFSHFFVWSTWHSVIGIGIDGDAATRGKQSYHLYIFWLHQLHQVLHDDINTVLLEVAMVTEGEEIELQTLRLYHALGRNIHDLYLRKVRLSSDRTERRKLRTIELHPLVVVLMLVLKGFQYLWCIVHLILGLLA